MPSSANVQTKLRLFIESNIQEKQQRTPNVLPQALSVCCWIDGGGGDSCNHPVATSSTSNTKPQLIMIWELLKESRVPKTNTHRSSHIWVYTHTNPSPSVEEAWNKSKRSFVYGVYGRIDLWETTHWSSVVWSGAVWKRMNHSKRCWPSFLSLVSWR